MLRSSRSFFVIVRPHQLTTPHQHTTPTHHTTAHHTTPQHTTPRQTPHQHTTPTHHTTPHQQVKYWDCLSTFLKVLGPNGPPDHQWTTGPNGLKGHRGICFTWKQAILSMLCGGVLDYEQRWYLWESSAWGSYLGSRKWPWIKNFNFKEICHRQILVLEVTLGIAAGKRVAWVNPLVWAWTNLRDSSRNLLNSQVTSET